MSLAFPRSLRSLSRDTGRATLIGIGMALAVLLAWGLWFALARVPIYATSQELGWDRDGAVVARFAPADLARIRRGHSAHLLIPATAEAPAQALPAVVITTPDPRQDLDGLVRLHVTDPPEALSGLVQIEVAYVTPLELILTRFPISDFRLP